VEIYAEQEDAKSEITIRKIEPQVVIYTIYRGEYQKIGQPIGNLYSLAMKKQIWPKGSVSLVYLNSPQYVSGEHCLVEIRIPVGKEALKKAGTFGEMTDIKELKAMEVAVIKKPAGQMNYGSLYNSLYKWIAQNGYRNTENACEIFSGIGGADYSQMSSEIMVPVEKLD
jgi:effector-binding domain-containing protein